LRVYGEGEETDPADELMQGNALIRANFGVNPDGLENEKWAQLFCEAVWLESERLKNFAQLMAKMWGG
jgi:hypothetical protein